MLDQKIREIIDLAHSIDKRINLFSGYEPKKLTSYKGELLFWRQVVSLYGLFSDCDRVQIKEQNNLFDLMNRYLLIERKEYSFVKGFWNDISYLRKWLCHNNNMELFYCSEKHQKIKDYLNNAFALSSVKPTSIEEIQRDDWNMLQFNIDSRYNEYLQILKKGLMQWNKSDDKEEINNQWIEIFAEALFNDKELISNIIAEIAQFEKINNPICSIQDPL